MRKAGHGVCLYSARRAERQVCFLRFFVSSFLRHRDSRLLIFSPPSQARLPSRGGGIRGCDWPTAAVLVVNSNRCRSSHSLSETIHPKAPPPPSPPLLSLPPSHRSSLSLRQQILPPRSLVVVCLRFVLLYVDNSALSTYRLSLLKKAPSAPQPRNSPLILPDKPSLPPQPPTTTLNTPHLALSTSIPPPRPPTKRTPSDHYYRTYHCPIPSL